MSELIEIKKHVSIVEVALNRQQTYNAFNLEMVECLTTHLTQLATDDAVRGIIITGKGPAFCAGGDLKWAIGFSERPGASFHALASKFHLAIVEIRRMKKHKTFPSERFVTLLLMKKKRARLIQ